MASPEKPFSYRFLICIPGPPLLRLGPGVAVDLLFLAVASLESHAVLADPQTLEIIADTGQWLAECAYEGRSHTSPK